MKNNQTHCHDDNSNRLMSQTQLAEHLGVSRKTVQRLTASATIPTIWVGRLPRYNAVQVVEALAELGASHA